MTAQVSETLIYEGEEVQLHSEPHFPLDHPEIIKAESSEGIFNSTACWRGYVGTWELKDRKLLLKNIEGKYTLKTTPIEASWFTGQLVIPESGKGAYFHGGWGHDYAQNKIITVVKGNITSIEYQDKAAPDFIDGWVKTRLNRILGAITEASDSCHVQLDENKEDSKIFVFIFEQKTVLETMTGKLFVTAQECKLALPISTCLAKPNLIKGNKAHMLTVSIPLRWAVELEQMFISNNWASKENSLENINGFWHFSEKEVTNNPNSGGSLWDEDIPF